MRKCIIEAQSDCERKTFSVNYDDMENVMNILMEVFRNITVIDAEYGEVLYNFYVAPQLFGESGSSKQIEDFLLKTFPKSFEVLESEIKETDWQEFLKYLGEEN